MTENELKAVRFIKSIKNHAMVTLDHIAKEEPNVSPLFYKGREEKADTILAMVEELKQYRAIGAPEECRAAVKQTAKKPIFNHNLSDTLSVFHCECGNTIKVSRDIGIMNNNNAPNYCSKCGCKFDWSDEE